jgi:hypothetical protein
MGFHGPLKKRFFGNRKKSVFHGALKSDFSETEIKKSVFHGDLKKLFL